MNKHFIKTITENLSNANCPIQKIFEWNEKTIFGDFKNILAISNYEPTESDRNAC